MPSSYSGPAMAAGAISKAISDLFEGVLAGQKGGLEAEKSIRGQGLAEREMLMKAASLPHEIALAQAQAGLLGAQTGRLNQMTPAEVAQTQAETGRIGAQTGLLGQQTFGLTMDQRLQKRAIEDWDRISAQAKAAGRPISDVEHMEYLRRNQNYFMGAQRIPVSELLNISRLEALMSGARAQDPYKGPQTMLTLEKAAQDSAKNLLDSLHGINLKQGSPEYASVLRWFAAAERNRMLRETGMPNAQSLMSMPGAAPQALREYVKEQLRAQHSQATAEADPSWIGWFGRLLGLGDSPDEKELDMLTYQILSLVGAGAAPTWQAAQETLTPGQAPVNVPAPAVPAPPAEPAPPAPAAPTGKSSKLRYNPATGEWRQVK